MLHTVTSDNKFFERPTDPGVAVDGVYPDTAAPDRPGLGAVVKVKLYSSASDLPDLTLDNGGHWSYSWNDDAATSAIIVGVADETGTVNEWSDAIWSTQSFDTMAGLSGELDVTNEIVKDNGDAILALQTNGSGGGAQILVQEAGGYPAKSGTGNAVWVGKDKPAIGGGYATGNDLYFQTTSI